MSAGVVGTKVQQLILVALLVVATVATGFLAARSVAAEVGAHAAAEAESTVVATDGWEW
ncbi:hypothetical protein [Catenuloplanes atrovinosus]|uniref:Uncharacterized protein n=1 Tax=Catenuloplanes atrovinosus TaxID=137266 RepID=A0AAE3YVR3_9ACTN|nr:hypothetical protein [Catenuloplanes atrovinosus]MDR7279496.1 hypothetical protein [Catenuloplanes atrovinosus]